VERVFDFGFAIRPTLGGSEPLLKGRKLYSITFSGAPETWLRATHGLEALRTIFDDHLASVTGLQVVGHFHTGGIVPGLREDAVQDIFEAIDRDVRMCFPR